MGSHNKITKVKELENFLKELEDYRSSRLRLRKRKRLRNDEVTCFNELFGDIVRKVGAFGSLISELTDIDRVVVGQREYDMWVVGLKLDFDSLTDSALEICIHATTRAIGKLKSDIKMGIRDEQGNTIGKLQKLSSEPPKAFIAHEGKTKALDKLEDFLDALGVKHSIAEDEPSNGRQIEGQVISTYEQADFVIILATKGKAINRKARTSYMGLNIADELGRAREAKKRIILLLQKGVEPHTNISGIVHERFTPQSMDKAFIKIVKELRNWSFIRASKPNTEKNG